MAVVGILLSRSPDEAHIVARRFWKRLGRMFTPETARRREPPPEDVPVWAQVTKKRLTHIRGVAALLDEWATEMGVSQRERTRWLKAAWLHDALRDASLPRGLMHGDAAADRAARDGESDQSVLDAVRYHSTGYAGWDSTGKMLFLADYLEPGRGHGSKQRAKLAKRVPRDRDDVLREVVSLQMRARLRTDRRIPPMMLEFWNALTQR
jgi:HD superfamily phosphohydrolase YqeK